VDEGGLISVRKITFLLILCCAILPWTVLAQEEEVKGNNELKLYMGETRVIEANVPSRVVVGNPSIVDISDVSEDAVTLTPKAVGVTTFMLKDSYGEQSYRVRVMSEDMSDIKLRIDGLLKELNLPGVYTRAAESEGKVLMLGAVKTADDIKLIDTALGPLKDKTTNLIQVKEEEAVVDIKVEVLELDKDATSTLGFTWPAQVSLSDAGITTPSLSSVFHVLNYTRAGLSAKLDLLVQEGKAKVLSRPNVACQSGKEAELLVGGEKPTFTTTVSQTGGATSSTVEYKEFGIKLNIKPVITSDDRIHLKLVVEVSEVGDAELLGPANAPTAKAYPLTKRSTTTELYLNDNQTLAIGGLMKQKSEDDVSKVPGLGDIPGLGGFFRKRITKEGGGAQQRGNTELFITLTPRIISKGEQAPQNASAQQPVAQGVAIPETKIASEVVVPSETAAPKEAPAAPAVALLKEAPSSNVNIIEPATEGGVSTSLADYINTVYKKIIDAVYYPQDAKNAGWQGTTKLSLNINYDGTLKEVKLLQSSGYSILDQAALETVYRQAPYPTLPEEVNQDELRIEIPVAFRNN
jgi:pilus assembly protein CpaC